MQRGWFTVQALGWIPEEEGERNSIHFHHEILAPARPFNVLRVPTNLCRTCRVAVLDYAPEGLIYRG